MSHGTVFPDIVVGFAESITGNLQEPELVSGGAQTSIEWLEEISEVAASCSEVRKKIEKETEALRKRLTSGVETSSFLAAMEPLRSRLDKIIIQGSSFLSKVNGSQNLPTEFSDLYSELEQFNKACITYRDLLVKAVAQMKLPHPAIDWQRVEHARAAHNKGETKQFTRTSRLNGK